MSDRSVERLLRKYLDKRDDKLVEIVERCLRKGYDYEKMKDRVSDHLRDSSVRKRLVEALSDSFPQFARKRKQRVVFLFGIFFCFFFFGFGAVYPFPII